MKKYRPKSPAANVADKLLRLMIAAALGVGWFVYLWGLSLPALSAGLALGMLFWLCARLFGKKSVEKREKQMRQMLGGELALDRLLTMSPRHAAFQAAVWLSPKYPMEMQRAAEWSVSGTLEDKPAQIRLIAQHESVRVTAQQLVTVVREARQGKADICVLCVTAPLAREADEYLHSAPVDLRLVKRDELALLAGLCSPATDEDLARLSHKKRTRRTAKQWIAIILSPGRARRYFWYGAGMAALAFVTGQWVYPLPAVVCLALFAGCKARELRA